MSEETTEELRTRLNREHREKVASGEYCSRCNTWIFRMTYPGHAQLCYDCKALASDGGEVASPKYVRCPACGHSFDPYDGELYELFTEGEHDVVCPECGHEFEVTTTVSYTFRSPGLTGKDEAEDGGDDDNEP